MQPIIAFRNLHQEMKSQGLTIQSIANSIGMERNRLARKLAQRIPISLAEAAKINRKCFPSCTIQYLFAEHLEK